jgi:hypothetical protein
MILFKQYKIPYVGAFTDILGQCMLWIGMFNFFLNVPTAYVIWVKTLLPWMSLPLFIGLIILLGLLGMLFVYMFVIKSYYGWRARQYENDGTKALLNEINERLKRLEGK